MDFLNINSSKEDYSLVYENDDFPLNYKVTMKTNLVLNDNKYNEIESEMEWVVEFFESNERGYIVNVKSFNQKLLKYPPHMESLMDITQLYNYPLSDLLLQLNQKGQPIAVLNPQDVLRNWVDVRDNDLAAIDDGFIKAIITAGNIDFSEPLSVINSSLVYNLFFNPVYGIKKISKAGIKPLEQDSLFFPQYKVNFDIKERLVNKSDTDLEIEHEGIGVLQEYDNAEKLFNETYKHMTEKSFYYGCSYKADYSYKHNGVLNKCVAMIREKVNESFVSNKIFSINLLKSK